ncbi:MAG: DoxX family protein [Fibrella sp.]|nr:DoxX family protein [Armatimonadota bacterium]
MKNQVNTATKVVYWGSTGLFALMMASSAIGYLTSDFFAKAFAHLGFPDYFRVELGIAKLLGVIVLLTPVPQRVKEWAYAGFAITMISAFIAHAAVDGIATGIPPLVALVILSSSYIWQSRMRDLPKPVPVGSPVPAG